MRKTINRSVLLIIPKQPFYDWANQVFSGSPAEQSDECEAYLLDDGWTVKEAERFLKANYDEFFQDMLQGWCAFPEAWPEKRTWKMFNEWFDWRFSSMVWDLLPDKRIRRAGF